MENKPLLSAVLKELLICRQGKDVILQDVAVDSRKVADGGVFVAVPGTKVDGHDFIPQASSRAGAVVYSHPQCVLPENISSYCVSDCARAAALLFREKYGRPDEALQLCGVTGTNGKTTTVFILEHLLKNCGLLSTVEFRDGRQCMPATHTTPDPETLFFWLGNMQKNGLKFAAMELSSHALDQDRAFGARFQRAVFTNLTGDHLDYHKDMEQYYQAKKRFFTRLLVPEGKAVINVDDPYGRRLSEELKDFREVISFGTTEQADWQIRHLQSTRSGVAFELVSRNTAYTFKANLPGSYNAYNLSGAVLTALSLGKSYGEISRALQEKITVPGRMQFFDAPGGAGFAVDFAHTDDALMNVLRALRPLTEKRLFCVFGAGGNRDKTKRPRMGRAAACADFVIVTSDNPRDEKPEDIIADIVAGIPAGTAFEIEVDRRKAIERAFALAQKGDIVLIAGKGHENYQEIAGVKHPFSDAQVIRTVFSGRNENE